MSEGAGASRATPEGRLTATRDAPARRPGRARGRDDARRLDLGRRGAQAAPIARTRTRAGALGAIAVQSFPLVSWTKRRRVYRLPVIRGVVALVESLGIGLRALGISANAQLPEEEQEISGGGVGRDRGRSRSCSRSACSSSCRSG